MSDERAERLREVVDRAEANSHPPYPDWAADMPTRVLRAIVTELGITREMSAHYEILPCPTCAKTRDAFAALLDAAGK